MTKLNWIIIAVVAVVLILVVVFVYKKFQLESATLANQQLVLQQQQPQSVNNLGLVGGIISGVLNSSSVTGLLSNVGNKK